MLHFSLNSLIVFSTVVKLKSFSKAADVLCMTQPGVSHHVAQLEAQTGIKLINRENGAFTLTKEGRTVYKYAERIGAITWELDDKILAIRKNREPSLSIGTTINYARNIMPFIVGGFQRRAPNIAIKLDSGPSIEMEKTLLSGRNDVIIVAHQHLSKKIQAFPFVNEELMLITAKNHALAKRKAVSLADISPYPFIIREDGSATRSVVLDAFSRLNILPSVLTEANSTEFIKEWVSQGKGVSILIRRAVENEENDSLTVIPLLEPLFLQVSVAYLKSKKYDHTVLAFIAYLKELMASPDPRGLLLSNKEINKSAS
ncbi:MAG: HTH-type transcriptional activator CmpR [Syntrophorhabdaceae bacterium PtaU1.Bin034]|nr:MAG: HTH-type transcriptional activator CmpR [Syntrophorhabdaceae bacterium PtaU1.Bin034]